MSPPYRRALRLEKKKTRYVLIRASNYLSKIPKKQRKGLKALKLRVNSKTRQS